MRLVTAVTTLIQLKRSNYFRPKNPLSEIEFLSGRQDRIANVWCGCAPCKGGAFQWVEAPPGNRSSRKQSEQSWR